MRNKHTVLVACLGITALIGAAACASRSRAAAAPAATPGASRVGDFVWQDLITEDAEKSRAFYEQLFGWKFERTTRLGRPYLIGRSGSTPVGGIAQVERRQPDEPIAQWISFLAVADVDATAARVTGSGGQMLVAPTAVNTSRAAIAVDPQGAAVGLVTLGANITPPVGGRAAPIGTFFWRDYLARDVDAARTFYSNLAGLTADRQTRSDLLIHYILTRPGPAPVAGIVAIGEQPVSPNWLPYIRVNDPAPLATRAEQLGGRILVNARADLRNGSVAVITDPGGAAMALQKWPF
jgi:predicted enzyme related to lactoylglutathione lyase